MIELSQPPAASVNVLEKGPWVVVLQVPPACPAPALGIRDILISGTPDRT
jgi:hypothetical protein